MSFFRNHALSEYTLMKLTYIKQNTAPLEWEEELGFRNHALLSRPLSKDTAENMLAKIHQTEHPDHLKAYKIIATKDDMQFRIQVNLDGINLKLYELEKSHENSYKTSFC
ncbi:MAG: hypothetical protein KIT56_04165 [Gammaproteobacteria bacterium]|nr:hypothetical protein [Gammaproteobacteria bacterium]MCW5583072.1 hypothetical protein [Gammaproteobacteria bacterium]